jgi:hypothetical protein
VIVSNGVRVLEGFACTEGCFEEEEGLTTFADVAVADGAAKKDIDVEWKKNLEELKKRRIR